MTKQTKILIGIFITVLILAGGFFIYNKLLAPEKPVIPTKPTSEKPVIPLEKVTPKFTISAPSEIEVVAYKPYSFNFSIKNEEEYLEAKNVNVTLSLRETPILVSPNDIAIFPGESQSFEAKLDGLEPGDFNLYLDIRGEPDVNISKEIPIKSQIVVGLDEYHTLCPLEPCLWKMKRTSEGIQPMAPPFAEKFMRLLNGRNIKTKVIESQFTPEILENINILIIAKPTKPILTSEKQELKNLLNRGGGLLLAGSVGGPGSATTVFLNDLAKFLHLCLKFNSTKEVYYKWAKEIKEHQITSGIEAIFYPGQSYLEVEIPMVSLVELDGYSLYAIQYYAKGKIGAVGDYSMFVTEFTEQWDRCPQCYELNFDLIKWLATPPTPQELEEMG